MGKVIKVLSLIVLILVSSGLLIRYFVGEHRSALFKVFEVKNDGFYFHKFLGLIPKEIKQKYSTKVLDSLNGSEVVSLSDQTSSTNMNFIVLRSNSKGNFIKGYPWVLFEKGATNEVDWENYVSYLINLDIYNQYLEEYSVTSKNEIQRKYCYFLSIPNDPYSYRIIEKPADIDSIIVHSPLQNKEALISSGHEIVDLNSIIFEDSGGIVYCWFVNHGLVKFLFTFEKEKLVKVESINLGYLGNEFPVCC